MTTLADPRPDTKQGSASRQSCFDLIRIFAMFLIVMVHFASHSGFEFLPGEISVNRFWVEFVDICGHISVNLFVLLSGYFRISSKNIKTASLLKFWLQLFFYSIGIYLLFVILGKAPLSFGEMIRRILPVSYSQWWFATVFFLLLLLSPYLNLLLNSLSRKQYLGFLFITCLSWCVIPTLTRLAFDSNRLLWFVFLYALAGYLRLYGCGLRLSAGKLFALSAGCAALVFLSIVLWDVLSLKSGYMEEKRTFFFELLRIPLMGISLLLFLGFSRLKTKPNPVISAVASAMFGVYLIHDHPYVRYALWLDLFQNRLHSEDSLLILRFAGETVLVFTACTLIELARIHLLENHYLPSVQKAAAAIDRLAVQYFHLEA